MTSVGSLLKTVREQQGRTIAQVAEELRITQLYVVALEKGDLKGLPGLFFYKSFVRQYATLLGIADSQIEPALSALAAPEAPVAPAAESAARTPQQIHSILEIASRLHFTGHPVGWSLAGLAGVLVLCSGFYAWWSRSPQEAATPSPAVVVTQPASTSSAEPVSTVPSNTPAVEAQPAVTEPAPDQNTLEVANGDAKPVVLSLSAKEKTWLRITSNGHTIFSGILQPSESRVVRGSDMATVKVGNAAGLEVRVNGKPIGPIGERGQVRTVRVTSENFEILPPADAPDAGDPNKL